MDPERYEYENDHAIDDGHDYEDEYPDDEDIDWIESGEWDEEDLGWDNSYED